VEKQTIALLMRTFKITPFKAQNAGFEPTDICRHCNTQCPPELLNSGNPKFSHWMGKNIQSL